MKKNALFYLIAFLLAAPVIFFGLKKTGILVTTLSSNRETGHEWNEFVIGVYDHSGKSSMQDFNQIQQISVVLNRDDTGSNFQKMLANSDSKNPVLITVETLAADGENVLENSIKGKYDSQLEALCEVIKLRKNVCYLRWNPEMEVPVRLFPWQYQSSQTYIAAFRHIALLCKTAAPAIQIVWGTAGYPGTDEYWPGSDAVDLIGININSKSEMLATAYPPEKDVITAIRRKIMRMRFMEKPVLVTSSADGKTDSLLPEQLAISIRSIIKEDSTIYSFIKPHKGTDTSLTKIPDKIVTGVYDPLKVLISSPLVQAEHLFIDLENFKDGAFSRMFKEVTDRKHDVIITFEPWRDKNFNESTVLLNTINGLYDRQLNDFYQVISNAEQTVYIRFLHEMEIPIHRYPWQSQDPVLYIKAFRYFMNFNKIKSGNIKKVWGPAGDRGSIEWWPGDDVVDYVSIAIYGLPDKNITDPYKQEMFSSIYNRKCHRMRFTRKPIFITEFGVTGPEDFQNKWLVDAASTINSHREIAGICYFNLADNPKVWGDIPTPVWSISRKTFDHFMQELSE